MATASLVPSDSFVYMAADLRSAEEGVELFTTTTGTRRRRWRTDPSASGSRDGVRPRRPVDLAIRIIVALTAFLLVAVSAIVLFVFCVSLEKCSAGSLFGNGQDFAPQRPFREQANSSQDVAIIGPVAVDVPNDESDDNEVMAVAYKTCKMQTSADRFSIDVWMYTDDVGEPCSMSSVDVAIICTVDGGHRGEVVVQTVNSSATVTERVTIFGTRTFALGHDIRVLTIMMSIGIRCKFDA